MAPTRHNPNGLEDGMVVRKVSSPSKVFRVRGNPDAGGATFVALSKGERTVLNGNARNYRPEVDAEANERLGDDVVPEATDLEDEPVSDDDPASDDAPFSDDDPDQEPEPQQPRRSLYAVEKYQEPDIVELCDRMRDAVARLDDDTCSPADAAAIVKAAAELNWAVATNR